MKRTNITVVIPAYNEASVIARSLGPLAEAAAAGELEIIVVANGCHDDTADQARAICPAARVLETSHASKTNALNIASDHTQGRAIVFLDADLTLTLTDLNRLVEPILDCKADVSCGRMVPDTSGSVALVRAFYRGWQLNPYFDHGKFGGVFALSDHVVKDIFPLPAIVADDEYIGRRTAGLRRHFVPEASFTVRAPTTLSALFRIRRRSRRGTAALEQAAVATDRSTNVAGFRTVCARAARQPGKWGDVAVYGAMMAAVRMSLLLNPAALNAPWEQDTTSRSRPT